MAADKDKKVRKPAIEIPVPNIGSGSIASLRFAQLASDHLKPSLGKGVGRPTKGDWRHRPKVPMTDETVRFFIDLSAKASQPGATVAPMQAAALFIEENIAAEKNPASVIHATARLAAHILKTGAGTAVDDILSSEYGRALLEAALHFLLREPNGDDVVQGILLKYAGTSQQHKLLSSLKDAPLKEQCESLLTTYAGVASGTADSFEGAKDSVQTIFGNAPLQLRLPKLDIYDCDIFRYASENGLDKAYGIEVVFEALRTSDDFSDATTQMLRSQVPDDLSVVSGIVAPRQILVGEDTLISTDVAVVGSSRVDLQACKLEYSIVSPK